MTNDEPIEEILNDETTSISIDSNRPEGIPDEFWDTETASLRADELMQSYRELQEQLGQSLPHPSDADPASLGLILSALGRPDSPDQYELSQDMVGVEADAELNAVLHAAGFTQAQASLVYQLASERLQPLMNDMSSEVAAVEQRMRLEQHFGGPDHYKQIASDLQQWGASKFGQEALDTIASSYDGVLALHQMMATCEPEIVGSSGDGPNVITKEQLNEMVADPRYWRDRDPAFIGRVTAGFAKIFSG